MYLDKDTGLTVPGAAPGGGSGGGGGAFDLVKVTEYTPYQAPFYGITKVNFSGFGYDEMSGMDYSEFNGDWTVENSNEPDPLKRTFKRNDRYLYFFPDPDYRRGGDAWCINLDKQYGGYETELYYNTTSELTNGTINWSSMGGGAATQCTVTKASYPEVQLVLKGQKATAYDPASKTWTWGTDVLTFSSAEVTLTKDAVYAATGNAIIGSKVAWAGEFPIEGIVFYAPLLTDVATAETGQALVRNGGYTFDNGAVFNDNGSMSFDIGSSAPQGTAPATASIWFNGGKFDYEQLIIGWGSEGNVLSLQMDTSGILYATNRNGQRIDSPKPLSDNTWHHFCVTTSGGYATMYVDGNKVAEGNCGINISGTGGGIGGGWWRNTMYAKGTMKAARIYNRVLSDDEIMALAGEF